MNAPKATIILPVFNETTRLIRGVTGLVTANLKHLPNWEIIIVDDGSLYPAGSVIPALLSADIRSQVQHLIRLGKMKIVRYGTNQGKGQAIATGVKISKGKCIVFADIDGSVPWEYLPTIIDATTTHPIVIGSRRARSSIITRHQPFLRETLGRVFTYFSTRAFGITVTDVTCGFKAFDASVAKTLFSQLSVKRFAFDTEVLARAVLMGLPIVELPVEWQNQVGSRVRVRDVIYSATDLVHIYLQLSMKKKKKLSTKRNQATRNKKTTMRKTDTGSAQQCDSCGGEQFTFLFDHHQNWKVQQCQACGLTQVIPRPPMKEVAALYHEDFAHFNPYQEQLDVHRAYFKGLLNRVRKYLADGKRQITLLDVGCALGVLLDEAEKQGIQAEGVDLSKDAVTYVQDMGHKATYGTAASFHKLFPSKRFNAITACEVIEHEYSPKKMVTAIYDMLKPGGYALVTTPNHGSWWRKVMGKYWPGYQHKEHLYFFDPASLETLFFRVGFTEVTVVKDQPRPFPLSFLFKRAADYFPLFAVPLRIAGAMVRPFGFTNPINPWDDLLVIAKK